MDEELRIHPPTVAEKLIEFIRSEMAGTGFSRLVVGLSGGLDSSVSAYLAVQGVGRENLVGIIMPYATSQPRSREDALMVADELGISHKEISITPLVDAYFREIEDVSAVRKGNFMARMRMAVLYDQSVVERALVLGTGNRTEALLGYTTLWGDMACAFTPLGCLFKTEVRQLAAWLGVPQSVLEKPPSADLWEGQTDEGELGVTYEEADHLLLRMVDLGKSDQELVEEGFAPELVGVVRRKIAASEFKRKMPNCPRREEILSS